MSSTQAAARAESFLKPVADPAVAPAESPAANREIAALRGVQRRLGAAPVVAGARALSFFGEHSAGWFALGLLGAAVDRRRRGQWLGAAAGVVGAHAASIAVKRVVRRPRPDDEGVKVLVGTPSKLSFPSSHAASTTAAAVLYGGLIGRRSAGAVVPPMLVSRMVLGVHYPSDVLAGSALGAAVGGVVLKLLRRGRSA